MSGGQQRTTFLQIHRQCVRQHEEHDTEKHAYPFHALKIVCRFGNEIGAVLIPASVFGLQVKGAVFFLIVS